MRIGRCQVMGMRSQTKPKTAGAELAPGDGWLFIDQVPPFHRRSFTALHWP